MTSIASSLNSQYYQLNGQAPGMAVPTPSLSAALSADDGTVSPSSSASDAFLLDLSPQAQSILGGGGGTTGGDGSFTLTPSQQSQISAILAKYKNAPMTQDTYNQIQNDLQAAGLSPQQLAQQDQAKSFNATQVLINALSGQQTDTTPVGASDAQEQTKSSTYMQNILSQWQSMSTQGSDSSGDGTQTSGASA